MKYVVVITLMLAAACGGTTREKGVVVAGCTAATLAAVKSKLPTDDKASAAIELAAAEVSCVLAGLSALAPAEGK
jgi:hypothetical protein